MEFPTVKLRPTYFSSTLRKAVAVGLLHTSDVRRATLRGALLTDADSGEETEIPGELFRATAYEFLVNS